MRPETRVLIVGGYGVFGQRIVALLENEPRLTLVVAGRSLRRAEDFTRARQTKARLEAAVFDRNADVGAQLAEIAPVVVVDASGPFQAYGTAGYSLIEACMALRIHYLDLADGSDFVAGVRQFDAAARAAGVCVLTGLSSCPVLTAAVVRSLSKDMPHVDAIRAGIAPSPFAGVGENVIRAIASYAGQRVQLRRNGTSSNGFPFTEHMPFTIAPPGRVPLRRNLFSLIDVPDLRVLAELWPEVEHVWVGAGPVPRVLHRALIACAWLVRVGVVSSLLPLASLMHRVTNRLRWGEHRGGMFVTVAGRNVSGDTIERSWHLVAERDDGPLIPSMAVAAVIRRMLDGQAPAPGARAAARDLEVADYERLFAARSIHTGVRDERVAGPLYARLLGPAWNELPDEVRDMHDLAGDAEARGTASVVRGRGVLARLAASLMRFPPSLAETPLAVRFTVRDGVETWTRTFGAHRFSSRQDAGRGRADRLLCERFGPLTFDMALVSGGGRLSLVLRRGCAFGVPLPLWLCPRVNAYETAEGRRFRFYVEIRHPLTGLIVRYEGSLSSPQPI